MPSDAMWVLLVVLVPPPQKKTKNKATNKQTRGQLLQVWEVPQLLPLYIMCIQKTLVCYCTLCCVLFFPKELSSMEEKMEYQLEERTRDMQELLETCQTRVSGADLDIWKKTEQHFFKGSWVAHFSLPCMFWGCEENAQSQMSQYCHLCDFLFSTDNQDGASAAAATAHLHGGDWKLKLPGTDHEADQCGSRTAGSHIRLCVNHCQLAGPVSHNTVRVSIHEDFGALNLSAGPRPRHLGWRKPANSFLSFCSFVSFLHHLLVTGYASWALSVWWHVWWPRGNTGTWSKTWDTDSYSNISIYPQGSSAGIAPPSHRPTPLSWPRVAWELGICSETYGTFFFTGSSAGFGVHTSRQFALC